ncbi:MAG: hypothetical protein ACI8PB_004225, partial [Desulforhopalus sp.]
MDGEERGGVTPLFVFNRYNGYHLSKTDLPTLQTWVKLKATANNSEPKSRRQAMNKTI